MTMGDTVLRDGATLNIKRYVMMIMLVMAMWCKVIYLQTRGLWVKCIGRCLDVVDSMYVCIVGRHEAYHAGLVNLGCFCWRNWS